MATHSSTLAWKIPGMEEPGGLPSMGLHRVRHDWSDLAAAAAAVYIISVYWSCIQQPGRKPLLDGPDQKIFGFSVKDAQSYPLKERCVSSSSNLNPCFFFFLSSCIILDFWYSVEWWHFPWFQPENDASEVLSLSVMFQLVSGGEIFLQSLLYFLNHEWILDLVEYFFLCIYGDFQMVKHLLGHDFIFNIWSN